MKKFDTNKYGNVIQMRVAKDGDITVYVFSPYKAKAKKAKAKKKAGKFRKVMKKVFSRENITTFGTILAIVQALYKIIIQILSWLGY